MWKKHRPNPKDMWTNQAAAFRPRTYPQYWILNPKDFFSLLQGFPKYVHIGQIWGCLPVLCRNPAVHRAYIYNILFFPSYI
ncbi:hypothetical protein KY389_01300 [Paracoccus bogoriensis]|uniref:hypothetical protein n=1 Tax=Paracoccus bogoriensis TaxID=242065 RepID=UPI001CA46F07|nr:hypothetical protein [Paracoccus bogoriensis]MBW7055330.1 hypothetical protein [Paracoccus bogoriensis]